MVKRYFSNRRINSANINIPKKHLSEFTFLKNCERDSVRRLLEFVDQFRESWEVGINFCNISQEIHSVLFFAIGGI